MPYSISTSQFSFIQFAETDQIEGCNWPATDMCLPVFDANDAWFQFVITGSTEAEADDLCDATNENVMVGLVLDCADGFLIEFVEKPQRYRISATKVLYIWQHGLPGFDTVIDVEECFHVKISVFAQTFCSNCLQRIGSDCHTSVLEYTNNENAFGFNYCASSSDADADETDCDPTIISFTNQATMTIPWTAFLQDKYGTTPTVQAWLYDVNGELVAAGIRIALDTFPPTELRIDFGGVASGIVKII